METPTGVLDGAHRNKNAENGALERPMKEDTHRGHPSKVAPTLPETLDAGRGQKLHARSGGWILGAPKLRGLFRGCRPRLVSFPSLLRNCGSFEVTVLEKEEIISGI